MEIKRIILYVALGVVCFALWTAWQQDYGTKPTPKSNEPSVSVTATGASTATVGNTAEVPAIALQTTPTSSQDLIHVKTDILEIAIDPANGDVVTAKLVKYPKDIENKDIPIQILNAEPNELYVAQSGLSNEPIHFIPKQHHYELNPGEKTLTVTLESNPNGKGLVVTKTFEFTAGSYAINVNYKILNETHAAQDVQFYNQIKRLKPEEHRSIFALNTYTGAAISSSEKLYEKLSYSKLDEQNLSKEVKGGWLAMQQRYFLSAWIPNQDQTHHYYSEAKNNIYTIGLSTPVTLSPGKETNFGSKLYVGPELVENLAPLAKGLDLTIDYGWLSIFSIAIFWVMKQIYNFVGNWGWSIIIVTLLIKLAFFKLSETSYKSMARMRLLTPRIKELQERYAGDKQKISKATMELYRKEKVNPLGGCLPIIIQIPVFIALYWVLIEAVQLRQAPFIFWIHDLAAKDPYYVLPILMGLTMFLTQKLNPPAPDPMQAKMMMLMPVFLTVLFLGFPSGLVLYWVANNLLSLMQQWYIIRKYEQKRN